MHFSAVLGALAAFVAVAPAPTLAQFTEIKMGEYLHTATAAANGGVYAGYSSIGYQWPAVYHTNTDWVGLPITNAFNTVEPVYGSATAISHDGSVVAGYVMGTVSNGIAQEYAAYWVNGVESLVPAPPDDPGATELAATAVSGDGSTLLVQDGSPYSATAETYVYKIASGTFTSLGFLGNATHQTYATAINLNGTVVAGYSTLDDNNINGFIWNASNGVTVLGIPTNYPNTAYLEPTCMSDDGSVVFGRLTEFNGWVGFRYSAAAGYQDFGNLPYMEPTACTADGSEAVGIADLYFPAVWSVGNGGGYLDHLMTAHGTTQALGTLSGPATISPDGTAVTGSGPDFYPVDQVWTGAWQIVLPFPLRTAPIPQATMTVSTPYQETLTEPAGTLTQYAEFNTGVSAVLVTRPHDASSFTLNADGSFVYTPKPGFFSSGPDPENGNPDDRFTYKLTSPNGTSSNAQVEISVTPPMAPTVDTPTYANVTATTATLGGNVESDGGAALTSVGVVYAPVDVDSNPRLGDPGASSVAGSAAVGAFTVGVSNLAPNTTYYYAAYASNSAGISYSSVDVFTTPATFASWQQQWFGSTSDPNAAMNADPYHTGVANIKVFAFLGPYQDPSTASPAMLPQVQISGGNMFYSFAEPYGISGMTYGAQSSATMQPNDWHPVPDTGDPTAVPPTHVFSVPIGGANSQVYLRLTVTLQ